jgi:Flp pilus assembly protein TadD
MTPRLILSLGLSALVLGGTMVGCTATGNHLAKASDRAAARTAKAAHRDAEKAARALATRDPSAVAYAESAVSQAPRDAGYRMLLGQGYLQAGRFASARDTFADVVDLMPGNGKAALNLALAQIATGDWSAARATLDAHAKDIPAADLGLATALAGNPAGAITILDAAARAPGATAKIRQNLALSYALAGRWDMARIAAAADMSSADLDARMEQWAAFTQPKGAPDQVASLLGVRPVADAGRPVALALNAPTPVTPMPDAPVQTAAVETPTPVAAEAPAPAVQFAKVDLPPQHHAVQPAPAATPLARSAPAGDWFVQLGAFSNPAVARSGWANATRRFASLSGHQPTSARFAAEQGSLYRLSLGGFTRDAAVQMCRAYRAKGGACFVRREAGDRIAQWLRTPVQLASR